MCVSPMKAAAPERRRKRAERHAIAQNGTMAAYALALFVTCVGVAQAKKPLTCGQCIALQEGIYRSINRNITALEQRNTAGVTSSATIEIGQIIWHLCGSEPWRQVRPNDALVDACETHQRPHTDLMTEYWKEKSTEEYHDQALALRMKRAVCPNPEIDACSLDDLPDDYTPLNPKSDCAICQAVTADVFGIIHTSRERPTKKQKHGDNFIRMAALISEVCEDLPMRHPIRPEQRANVLEACQDFWEDHEDSFVKMIFERTPQFALSLCSEQLDACEQDMSPSQLYAFDPSNPAAKDEL